MSADPTPHRPLTGLVLGGGGARAAYQVGVLKALMTIRRESGVSDSPASNPFDVICGTSAGAINAAALACRADDIEGAIQALDRVWGQFRAEQVYRSDVWGVCRQGAQWLTAVSLGWLAPRWQALRPRSLLDNAPLGELLEKEVPFDRLHGLFAQGHLQALSISASSYSSGQHVTFYQSAHAMAPWSRSQRRAESVQLSVDHLLASSAIPFVFPARELAHNARREWFGDGSMRQSAPISPAIHLGAQKVLVIGVGRLLEPGQARPPASGYPSLAEIGGHAMSSIFLDGLAVDIERMSRINRTLALLPPAAREATPLRPVEALVIAPSQRLDDIAARYLQRLPRPVRWLLQGVGVRGRGRLAKGSALASYLLFESAYTRQLMRLGEQDALDRRQEVEDFFGWAQAGGVAQQRSNG
jgi:NTE family protein